MPFMACRGPEVQIAPNRTGWALSSGERLLYDLKADFAGGCLSGGYEVKAEVGD
jgi:hypothetical protein